MGALEDARGHLRKAREFLDAAELELSVDLNTAAASSAVLAGVNAKDAICLRLVGRTAKSDDHRKAVPELAAAGPARHWSPRFVGCSGSRPQPSTRPLPSPAPTRPRQWNGPPAWSTPPRTSSCPDCTSVDAEVGETVSGGP